MPFEAQNSRQVQKSLRFSLFDGIFASAMTGFTQDFFTPFALLLGATTRHIGILIALPNFFASLAQLRSADLTEKYKSRRKIINTFVLMHALVILPMAYMASRGSANPLLFIAVVVLFTAFNAIATPAWGSLMSDLVPEDKRGKYFGWRSRILGFITVGMTIIAGLILHLMRRKDIFLGFAIVFAAAFVFRMASWHFLKKMHEPPIEFKKEDRFTLFMFLARIKESNFAKFVLFVSLMNFSVNIVAPFFAVLMLKDLHFNYILYSGLVVTATLTINLVIGRWGAHADQTGNLKVIKLTSRLIGAIPLLWLVNRHPAFIFLIQVFAGFAWAGFNLCTSNFIYDAVTPAKRTRCIAYFNVFNGLALCLGAITGGILAQVLPPLFGYKILTLILVSSILRLLVSIFLPMMLKEVRQVKHISSSQLFFSVVGLKTF